MWLQKIKFVQISDLKHIHAGIESEIPKCDVTQHATSIYVSIHMDPWLQPVDVTFILNSNLQISYVHVCNKTFELIHNSQNVLLKMDL